MKSRAFRRVTIRHTWERLRVSFWIAPAVMSVAAVLLAWLMNWLDARLPNHILQDSRLVLTGTTAELRAVLIGSATTILATAGVVFTLLTLPLSTVAAQYGSRLLRVFLRDRTTQFVLGMFVGTFVYCIAAASSFPQVELEALTPQITVTMGMLLMLATFGSLILLIQHISTMLQAPNIVAAAGVELLDVVIAELAEETSSDDQYAPRAAVAQEEPGGHPILAGNSGYIQFVNTESLMVLARENDLVVRLQSRPGDFVRPGMVVARAWPAERVDRKLDENLRRSIQVGRLRTPTQDIEYAVNQLAEVAIRAMSPAINDPFTALTCLDYLGEGLAKFAQGNEIDPHMYDSGGRLRLVYKPFAITELFDAAFNMLRHSGCDNGRVLLHMLEVIETIGQEAKSPEVRQALLHHARLIQSESQAGDLISQDRQLIQQRSEALERQWSAAT